MLMDAVSIENIVRMLAVLKTDKNRSVANLERIATSLSAVSGADPIVAKAVDDIRDVIKYLAPL